MFYDVLLCAFGAVIVGAVILAIIARIRRARRKDRDNPNWMRDDYPWDPRD